eukprot:scaffold2100_cov87-Cylindrotheca_fusiformis.AAC.2
MALIREFPSSKPLEETVFSSSASPAYLSSRVRMNKRDNIFFYIEENTSDALVHVVLQYVYRLESKSA